MKQVKAKRRWRAYLRITWAIAAKDIVDAVRNKMVVTLFVAALCTVMMSQALPLFVSLSGKSVVVIYDAGESRLATALQQSDQFQVRQVDSQAEMEALLIDLNATALGVVVPADFDAELSSGQAPQVDGYVTWAKRAKARELKADFEQQAGELLGRPVRIDIGGHVVYPTPDSPGVLGMFAGTLVMMIFIVGGFVVPHLAIEEKRTRTMDALLISPVGIGQVVVGKALAGLFYCLVAGGAAVALQWAAFAHWGLVISVVVLGSLFVVALGLLMGNLFEDAQQMGFWMAIPMLVLFSAMFVPDLGLEMPSFLSALLYWLPTTAMMRVFRLSFTGGATMARALPDLGAVLGFALVLYGVVIWQVRRMDR
jgi:ABC-type multidrug transport system permease subunit